MKDSGKMNTAKKIQKQTARVVKDESLESLKSLRRQFVPEKQVLPELPKNNLVNEIIGSIPKEGFDQNAHAQETAAKLMTLRKRLKQIQEEELARARQFRQQQNADWEKLTSEKMQAEKENQNRWEFFMPAGKSKGKPIGPAAAAKQKATKVETGRKKA